MNTAVTTQPSRAMSWPDFLAKYSEKYHIYCSLIGAVVYLAWSWFDYVLLPHLWMELFFFRLIGSLLMILGVLLYKAGRILIVVPVIITALIANHGVAWMMPLTTGTTMALYFTGFNLCVVPTAMFMFTSFRLFIFVLLTAFVNLAIGFSLRDMPLDYVLINGGLSWLTVVAFSIGLFLAKMSMVREIYKLVKKVDQQNEILDQHANTDALTKTFNRRYLDKIMDAVASLGTTYSVVFCDLDGLKRINDTYGHEAGDKYIVECCTVLKRIARKTDIVIRHGGDELVVICPATTLEQAQRFVIRVDEEISKTPIEVHAPNNELKQEPIHMSIGIASSQEFSKDQLIKVADERMKSNKEKWYIEKGIKKYR